METKKDLQLEKFVDGTNSLANELLEDNRGYILIAYGEVEDMMASAFSSKGKLGPLAETLYACMKKDPMFANVVVAASNALVQSRMAQMQAEMPAAPEQAVKPKRNRKKIVS